MQCPRAFRIVDKGSARSKNRTVTTADRNGTSVAMTCTVLISRAIGQDRSLAGTGGKTVCNSLGEFSDIAAFCLCACVLMRGCQCCEYHLNGQSCENCPTKRFTVRAVGRLVSVGSLPNYSLTTPSSINLASNSLNDTPTMPSSTKNSNSRLQHLCTALWSAE